MTPLRTLVPSLAVTLTILACGPVRAQASFDYVSECQAYAAQLPDFWQYRMDQCLSFERDAQERAVGAWESASLSRRAACQAAGAGGQSYSPMAWCLANTPEPTTRGYYGDASAAKWQSGRIDRGNANGRTERRPMQGAFDSRSIVPLSADISARPSPAARPGAATRPGAEGRPGPEDRCRRSPAEDRPKECR